MLNVLAGKPGFKECSGANTLLDRLSGTCLPIVLGLIAAFATSAGLSLFWDNDMLYIISLGRSIISDGLPWVDPLTCNEGLHCIAQQWVFCIAMAALYDGGGKLAVCIAIGALWCACAAVIWRGMLAFIPERPRACAIATGIALFLMCPFIKTNPRMLDVACLIASAAAMERYLRSADRRKQLIWPFVCCALMANLHSTMWVLAALPVVLALFDGRAKGRRVEIGLALSATCLASTLSPYGIAGSTYLFLSLGGLSALGIGELSSLTTNDSSVFSTVPFAAFAWTVLRAHQIEHLKSAQLLDLVTLSTILLASMQIRNILLMAPFLMCSFAALNLRDIFQPPKIRKLRRLCVSILLALAITVPAVMLCYPASTALDSSRDSALEALEDHGLQKGAAVGNLFNTGGYLELAGYRPAFDERAELLLPQINGGSNLAGLHVSLQNGAEASIRSWLESNDFAALFAERGEKVIACIDRISAVAQDYGFREVYRDDNVIAWIKG